jgi:hypothetical protein
MNEIFSGNERWLFYRVNPAIWCKEGRDQTNQFSGESQSCSYMAMSSLSYIPDVAVNIFCQPINTDYANYAYFDKNIIY